MGVRLGPMAVATCVLACAGCGVGSVSGSPADTPTPVPVERPSDSPQPATPPPYAETTRELAAVARRFVLEAFSYDSCARDRDGLLRRAASLATTDEVRRLRASGPAHLRWWVLCQRNERASVRIDGVTQEATSSGTTLHVEALRTTRSDLSTVRDFVEVTLVMVRTLEGWRVNSAEGGGL
jgi:hypothetical protein